MEQTIPFGERASFLNKGALVSVWLLLGASLLCREAFSELILSDPSKALGIVGVVALSLIGGLLLSGQYQLRFILSLFLLGASLLLQLVPSPFALIMFGFLVLVVILGGVFSDEVTYPIRVTLRPFSSVDWGDEELCLLNADEWCEIPQAVAVPPPLQLMRSPGLTFFREVMDSQFQVLKLRSGRKNVTLGTIFAEVLRDATFVHVVDPYVRREYSIRDLIELLSLIENPRGAVVHLDTKSDPRVKIDSEEEIRKRLKAVFDFARTRGILFAVQFLPDIHDRSITTERYRITLGRGLLFREVPGWEARCKFSSGVLDPAVEAQFRPTLETEMIGASLRVWENHTFPRRGAMTQ